MKLCDGLHFLSVNFLCDRGSGLAGKISTQPKVLSTTPWTRTRKMPSIPNPLEPLGHEKGTSIKTLFEDTKRYGEDL